MTEIWFYVLDGADQGAVPFACRLADKIHQQQRRLYVHADDRAMAQRIDEDLWTFRQGSFVPHALADELTGADDPTAIAIGGGEAPPAGFDDVLINLADEVPVFFSQFQRAVEIVTPATREAARRHYKFYQDRGYPLETHQVS